jgi:ribosomal protein S18 acetylase RimI-like enzyme
MKFIMQKTSLLDQVKIRVATQQDLPGLEWNGEYTHFRRLYAQAFHRAQEGHAVLWIADLPEIHVVGQLFVQLESHRNELADGNHRAYIYGFRVRPPFRGQGIGTLLMQTAEFDLKNRGFQWVSLNVGRDNPRALQLYERLGYHVVAAEPGFWSYLDDHGRLREVHEPAWRMEKDISKINGNPPKQSPNKME